MIIKTFNETNFVQVSNSLARDERLSIDTRGLLTLILSYPPSFNLSVDFLLYELNKGKQADDPVGVKRLRRMTKEMTAAGYLKIVAVLDENKSKFVGHEWHVYGRSRTAKRIPKEPEDIRGEVIEDQTVVVPDELETANPNVATKAPTLLMDKFPAAKLFAELCDVSLTPGDIEYIQSEVGRETELWRRVVKEHLIGMTAEQRKSESYRQKSIKFCLTDFRRELTSEKERSMRSQYVEGKQTAITDINHPNYKQPRRAFSDYVSKYTFGSKEYENFKAKYVGKAKEEGNAEALKEVETYEGQERSLAILKERNRKLKK